MTLDDVVLKQIKEKLIDCDDATLRQAVSIIAESLIDKERQIDDLIENYYKIAGLLEKVGLATLKRSQMGLETTKE